MPLWAESRIHGDVYVRFGGRLSETYHRKVAWRRQPSLRVSSKKKQEALEKLNPGIIKEGKSSWQKDKTLMGYLKELQRKY